MKGFSYLSIRYPRILLFVMALLTIGVASGIPNIDIDASMESMFLENTESRRIHGEFKETFGEDEIIVIGIQAETGTVFNQETLGLVQKLTELFEELPEDLGVDRVVSLSNVHVVEGGDGTLSAPALMEAIPEAGPTMEAMRKRVRENSLLYRNLISDNENSTAINIALALRPDDRKFKERLVEEVRAITTQHCSNHNCYVAGIPVLTAYSSEYLRKDMLIFIPITILVIATILWLTFKSLLGVLLPLLSVGLALTWTLGLVGHLGKSITILSSVVPSLLLAVGIAYSIHVLTFFYGSRQKTYQERIAATLDHVFWPIVVTGGTTLIGFASLASNDVPQIRDFGIYASFGIMAATLFSMYAVPAVLALKPESERVKEIRATKLELWFEALLNKATLLYNRYPRRIIASGVLVIVLGTIGAFTVEVDTDYASYFEGDSEPIQALNFMRDELAGERPINIVLRSTQGDNDNRLLEPQNLRFIETIENYMREHSLISTTISIGGYLKELNKGWHQGNEQAFSLPTSRQQASQFLMLYDEPDEISRYLSDNGNEATIVGRSSIISSNGFLQYMNELQEHFGPLAKAQGLEFEITGSMFLLSQASIAIPYGLVKSLSIATFLVFCVFLVLFRNVQLSLIGLVANMVPILVYFALMSASGITLNTATSIAASLALGIAVDDTIHFMMGYLSGIKSGMSTVEALDDTLQKTGRALLFTTFANVLGFAVLALSSFSPLTSLGWLTACVLLVALIADLVLLPAMLLLWAPSKTRNQSLVSSFPAEGKTT